MNEHEPLPDELPRFASQLAALSPDAGMLDRDRLMYEAGAASAERSAAFWRRACGGVGAVAAVLLVGYAVPLVVSDTAPTQPAVAETPSRPPTIATEVFDPRDRPRGPSRAARLLAALSDEPPRFSDLSISTEPIDFDANRPRPSRAAMLKAAMELSLSPESNGASS